MEGGEVEEAGHCGQQLHHPAHDQVLVLARPLAQHTPETVQQVSNLYVRYIRYVANPGYEALKTLCCQGRFCFLNAHYYLTVFC